MASEKTPPCQNTDILIIGGGLAGLSMAALLGKAGINTHVVDRFIPGEAPEKIELTGRTVALMHSSLNVLEDAGVWEIIEPLSAQLQTMRIIDDSAHIDRTIKVDFPAHEIGLDYYGYNIPNAPLRAALAQVVRNLPSIKIHSPAALARYEPNDQGVLATLEDGTQIQAKLIIGADGRNSVVRAQAGIECWHDDYKQRALTCLTSHSRPHDHVATEFHRHGGPLAFVPLPDNRSSVVWVEKNDKAEALLKLSKQDFLQALQDASQGILGELTLETNPEAWPLRPLKAEKLIAPRTALIAESAHVMSPITAQGLNLSLRDVRALSEIIIEHTKLGLDPGSATALHLYAKRRRADINTRMFGVDKLNRMVANDRKSLRLLRHAGLSVLNTLPPLKHFIMQRGLATDHARQR